MLRVFCRSVLGALWLLAGAAAHAQTPQQNCATLSQVTVWHGFLRFSYSIERTWVDTTGDTVEARASVDVNVVFELPQLAGPFWMGVPRGGATFESRVVRTDSSGSSTQRYAASGPVGDPVVGPPPYPPGNLQLLFDNADPANCKYRFGYQPVLDGTVQSDDEVDPAVIATDYASPGWRPIGTSTRLEYQGHGPVHTITWYAPNPTFNDPFVLLTPQNIAAGEIVNEFGESGLPTATIHWSIEPGPLPEFELLLTPADPDWIPSAGADEESRGTSTLVTATLRRTDGQPLDPTNLAERIEFELSNVSREPGIALNRPHSGAKTTPDLQFDAQENSHLEIVAGSEQQRARTRGGGLHYAEEQIYVSAYDYGAYGTLRATATLSDGTTIEGRTSEGEADLRLPKRTGGSRIADRWKQDNDATDLGDDDDSETEGAGDSAHPGDGLTLYEEYRGLFENGLHVREGSDLTPPHPRRKDLFVVDNIGTAQAKAAYLRLQMTTGIVVHHQLRGALHGEPEVKDRVLNFNHAAAPHLVDQHAVVVNGSLSEGASETVPVAGAGDPFTPADVDHITIRRRPSSGSASGGVVVVDGSYAHTVMHELGHAIGMDHHGELDKQWVFWGTTESGGIQELNAAMNPQTGLVAIAPGATPFLIEVRYEDGRPFAPAGIPPGGLVYVALPHQQHSGDEDCFMRYDGALAVARLPGPSGLPLRIWTGGERSGLELCSSSAGTGVNAANRAGGLPSRFESATRGGCAGQVRVSDRWRNAP